MEKRIYYGEYRGLYEHNIFAKNIKKLFANVDVIINNINWNGKDNLVSRVFFIDKHNVTVDYFANISEYVKVRLYGSKESVEYVENIIIKAAEDRDLRIKSLSRHLKAELKIVK